MSPRHAARRGFTLTEILVALLIVGIIGAAMVRLILVQSRFAETQLSKRNARTVSRNAMNIMLTDLRMVEDTGGLLAASRDSVTVRVPVAFGMICKTGGNVVLSLLPVDSAMMALASYGGWAYRDSATGVYSYTSANTIQPIANLTYTGSSTDCTDSTSGPGVLSITYGSRATKIVQVDAPLLGAPNPGWPAFIYQNITYKFGSSSTFAGKIGLFRKIKSSGSPLASPGYTIDEIIAPFDTSAKFRFYVLNSDTAQSAAPTNLRDVRGIQLVLTGSSQWNTRETGTTRTDPLVTGVFFKNRRDP